MKCIPITHRAVAIAVSAGLLLLAAACGGPSAGNPPSSPSTSAQKALAFSRCVRAHGVPNWPDPTSNGGFVKESPQQLGVSSSQLQTAESGCQHLLPNTGNIDDNPVALQRWWNLMLRFTRCMHAHGVPNWPDPSPYPQDRVRPTYNLTAAGIGFHQGAQPGNIVNSPQIQAQVQRCESVVHENVTGWFI